VLQTPGNLNISMVVTKSYNQELSTSWRSESGSCFASCVGCCAVLLVSRSNLRDRQDFQGQSVLSLRLQRGRVWWCGTNLRIVSFPEVIAEHSGGCKISLEATRDMWACKNGWVI
jgi:hypothetical protein